MHIEEATRLLGCLAIIVVALLAIFLFSLMADPAAKLADGILQAAPRMTQAAAQAAATSQAISLQATRDSRDADRQATRSAVEISLMAEATRAAYSAAATSTIMQAKAGATKTINESQALLVAKQTDQNAMQSLLSIAMVFIFGVLLISSGLLGSRELVRHRQLTAAKQAVWQALHRGWEVVLPNGYTIRPTENRPTEKALPAPRPSRETHHQ